MGEPEEHRNMFDAYVIAPDPGKPVPADAHALNGEAQWGRHLSQPLSKSVEQLKTSMHRAVDQDPTAPGDPTPSTTPSVGRILVEEPILRRLA